MSVDISLDGVDGLKGRISDYEKDMIDDLKKIVKRNSTRLVRVAKNEAPQNVNRVGNFNKSLRNRIRSKDVSRLIGLQPNLAKTVASRAPHRHLVQLGTQHRERRNGFSTGTMPANDFMARAVVNVEPTYQRDIRERVLRKVEI